MRTSILGGIAIFAGSVALGVGCGGTSHESGFGDAGGGTSSGGTSSGGNSSGGTSSGGNLTGDGGTGTSSGGGGGCNPNPLNYDIPGNGCDDDGDGKVDNRILCDTSLPLEGDATAFANSIGLCQMADATHWGIVSVAYTLGFSAAAPSGNPKFDGQHGILPAFGSVVKPRDGARLGVLSSGYARECDDPTSMSCSGTGQGDPYFKGAQAGMTGPAQAPPGYPKAAAGCPGASSINDAIGVKLQIKVPANAQGLQFDFDFYSGEWPEWVCSEFNDAFVAWLTSTAYPGKGGDLNISFDSMNNPVSVNNGFFDRCTPSTQTGCMGNNSSTAACPGGPNELQGTGFYNMGSYCGAATSTGGGATGWLTTKAPAKQGETITLQYIVWDTGDQSWDSSVLVDNFQWQPGPTMTGTQRPPQ
jgi:hypothetical protein